MASSTLTRTSGLALIAGSVCLIFGYIPIEFLTANNDPAQYQTVLYGIVEMISLLGDMLILFGLPGLLSHLDRLGLVGVILTFAGTFLYSGTSFIFLVVFPWLDEMAPKLAVDGPPALGVLFLVAGIVFGVGGIVLGIATLRAGILPPFAVASLICGVILLNIAGSLITGTPGTILAIVAFILFAAPFGWMGYALIARKPQDKAQPTPAPSLKSAV